MQASAPALFDVPQDAVWRTFSGGLGFLSGIVFMSWMAQRLGWPWPAGAYLACMAAPLCGLFAWRVLRPVTGALRWNGTCWSWIRGEPGADIATRGEGLPGRTTLAIDAGRWMLLRFKAADGSVALWLPVSATAAGGDWHAWRALLYARRSSRASSGVAVEAVR